MSVLCPEFIEVLCEEVSWIFTHVLSITWLREHQALVESESRKQHFLIWVDEIEHIHSAFGCSLSALREKQTKWQHWKKHCLSPLWLSSHSQGFTPVLPLPNQKPHTFFQSFNMEQSAQKKSTPVNKAKKTPDPRKIWKQKLLLIPYIV